MESTESIISNTNSSPLNKGGDSRNQPLEQINDEPKDHREKKQDATTDSFAHDQKDSIASLVSKYQPVLALLATALLGAVALVVASEVGKITFMTSFMGLALIFFATLKLFDVEGFATSFANYDLISMRWPKYGMYYPFVELVLGLGLLCGVAVKVFALLTLLIMGATSVGVLRALLRKEDISCACTGSLVNVPLGSLSLVESTGMALMSILLLGVSF